MKTLKVGDKGLDATAANKMLMGHNVFHHQTLVHIQHGVFTQASADATKTMKWWLGFKKKSCTPVFGAGLAAYLLGHARLSPAMHVRRMARRFEHKRKFICPVNGSYRLIGWPGMGTHSWSFKPNNWESDNANDAGCKRGTPLVAVADGRIGKSFGPLKDPDPRYHGIRLHLITADNEFYYAHLINTAKGIAPGVHVKQGQLLGHSGDANGVDHLHIGMKYGWPTQQLFGE